ncbi:MerR family transcriptional regulator [Clostridium brassicae]|uniref:MerR family transcriptional regulator n=1 Tax=Clostridium brassicae TaxID=2999072 RepID=A0ABT4DCR8_9CLOT|nr:MerR family transcriptional regulator [Clostridium brassicae]MCY6960092.1 MerR family transcriptional regulator [Clostridium brassicae]
MNNYFSIGEMSKLHKISIQTLRYYDQIDLFKPLHVNKENCYRYYSISQFSQLDLIKYLKCLGMPLKEIKVKLNGNNEEMLQLLDNKIDIVNSKIRELEIIKKVLTKKKETIENGLKENEIGRISRKYFQTRSILSVDYEKELSYERTLELARRKIANMMEENLSIFYGGVSGLINTNDFLNNEKVHYKKSFVIIEKNIFNTKLKPYISEIPSGEFICMSYKGSYKNNYKHIKKLMDYIEYKRIPVEQYIYEICIIDPLSATSEDDLLTELQIKVKKRDIDLRCLV